MNKLQFEKILDEHLKQKNNLNDVQLAAHKVKQALERSKNEVRAKERRFIDSRGVDWTTKITDDEKEILFHQMCISLIKSKKPFNECYQEVANVLNISRKLNGKEGPAVLIQGDPKNN